MEAVKVCFGCGIEVDHSLVECPLCGRTLVYPAAVEPPPEPLEDMMTWSLPPDEEQPPVDPEPTEDPAEGPGEVEADES